MQKTILSGLLGLGCALTGASATAQLSSVAPVSSAVLASTGQVGSVVITPETMYAIATSKLIWSSLIKAVAPYMEPYSETLRMLALKKIPRLQPVASLPNPPAQVFANSYTQVISFGDSMSDTGNLFAVSKTLGGIGLPTEPNFKGRFSNGPVVLEAMSNALNLPLVNYAVGGARSGAGSMVPVYGMQAGMLKQIQDFLDNQSAATQALDPNALYVLWTGPDDYYADGNIYSPSTKDVITANIKQGLTSLMARGAKHFFVPLMPDLGITPSAHGHDKTLSTYSANAAARSQEFATAEQAMLQAFAKQYPKIDIRTFDTYTYSHTRLAQAAAEGYNVTEPCYTPKFMGLPGDVCANPDKYLFWDTNHPTAAGSLVIGTDFAKTIATAPALPSR